MFRASLFLVPYGQFPNHFLQASQRRSSPTSKKIDGGCCTFKNCPSILSRFSFVSLITCCKLLTCKWIGKAERELDRFRRLTISHFHIIHAPPKQNNSSSPALHENPKQPQTQSRQPRKSFTVVLLTLKAVRRLPPLRGSCNFPRDHQKLTYVENRQPPWLFLFRERFTSRD